MSEFKIGDMVTLTDERHYMWGHAGKITNIKGAQITVDLRPGVAYTSASLLAPLDPSRLWNGERVRVTAGAYQGEEGLVVGARNRRGLARVRLDSEAAHDPVNAVRMFFIDDLQRLDL